MSMNGKQVMDPMEVAGGMDLSDTEEVQVFMEEQRLEKVRKYFRSEAAKKEKEKEKVKKVRKTGMKAKKDDPPSWKGKDWIAFFGKQYVKTGKRTIKEVMEDKHLTPEEREKEVRDLKLDKKAKTWTITDGDGKGMTLEELAETDASTVIWGYLNSGGKAAMTIGNVTIRNAKLEMMKTTAKVETEDHWMKFLNHKEEVASDEEHEALLGNAGPPMRPRDWWDDDYNTNIHLDFEVEIYDLSGRRVRLLSEQRLATTGAYAISWDGTDESGNLVPPGVYAARVRVETNTSGAGLDQGDLLRTIAVIY